MVEKIKDVEKTLKKYDELAAPIRNSIHLFPSPADQALYRMLLNLTDSLRDSVRELTELSSALLERDAVREKYAVRDSHRGN